MVSITGADQVRLDEATDIREVIFPECDEEECDELTRLLAAGEAELVGGELQGWGRERTLKVTAIDGSRGYYHVDLDD